MDVEDFDVDQFRHPHESSVEWKLRETFFLKHKDKYPLNRLVCLAACFINYECYGCRYPEPVMAELRNLMEEMSDVLTEHRKNISSQREMQFVKSSGTEHQSYLSTLDGKVKSGTQSHDKDVVSNRITPCKKAKLENNDLKSCLPGKKRKSTDTDSNEKKPKLRFVKASDSFQCIDKHVETSNKSPLANSEKKEMFQKFENLSENEEQNEVFGKLLILKAHVPVCLSKANGNTITALEFAASLAQLTVTVDIAKSPNETGKYDCSLQIDFIEVASATASKKKFAKKIAFNKAVALLKKDFIKVEKNANRKPKLIGSNVAFATVDNELPVSLTFSDNDRNKLQSLVLIEPHPSRNINLNSKAVLSEIGQFNKQKINYDFREISDIKGQNRVQCLISMQSVVLADDIGSNKQDAKTVACDSALRSLREICWTIQIKGAADSSKPGLGRDEVFDDEKQASEAISETNVGHKLLKAMGWKGGGIGKKGTGIAEPVTVDSVINRGGLGLSASTAQGISKKFIPSIRQLGRNYINSQELEDLVFSPDFTREERALIHAEFQKLGLKTHSHGVGNERYLVVSRRRSPKKLLEYIMEMGGETDKYVLVKPGAHTQ